MIWYILESRCTGKSKAFETRAASWDEVSHNDKEVKVIDFKQYLLAEKLLKDVIEWRNSPGNEAFPCSLKTNIEAFLSRSIL